MTARLLGLGYLVKGVSGAQSRAPCSTSAEAVPGTYLGLNLHYSIYLPSFLCCIVYRIHMYVDMLFGDIRILSESVMYEMLPYAVPTL